MTYRPRQQILLVVVVILAFLESAERLSDVARDRRLLGNDERLGHEGLESNPVMMLLQVRAKFARARKKLWPLEVPGLSQFNKIFSRQLFDQALQLKPK
jgi:hypothetical protein